MPKLWTKPLFAACLCACGSLLPARTIAITDHTGKRWILAARSNNARGELTLEPNGGQSFSLADQGAFDYDLSTEDGTSAFRLTIDSTRGEFTQTVSRRPDGGMPYHLYLDEERGTVAITSILHPDPAAFRQPGSESEIAYDLRTGNVGVLISPTASDPGAKDTQPSAPSGQEDSSRSADLTECDMDCSPD